MKDKSILIQCEKDESGTDKICYIGQRCEGLYDNFSPITF